MSIYLCWKSTTVSRWSRALVSARSCIMLRNVEARADKGLRKCLTSVWKKANWVSGILNSGRPGHPQEVLIAADIDGVDNTAGVWWKAGFCGTTGTRWVAGAGVDGGTGSVSLYTGAGIGHRCIIDFCLMDCAYIEVLAGVASADGEGNPEDGNHQHARHGSHHPSSRSCQQHWGIQRRQQGSCAGRHLTGNSAMRPMGRRSWNHWWSWQWHLWGRDRCHSHFCAQRLGVQQWQGMSNIPGMLGRVQPKVEDWFVMTGDCWRDEFFESHFLLVTAEQYTYVIPACIL